MKLEHLVNYLKGFLMGAADIVPGVSGGTIALLTGIYPRMIRALSAPTKKEFWSALFAFRIREILRELDFALMAAVALGVLSAVFSLVSAIAYLLDNSPHLLLGFFFGLVVASAVYVCTLVREYRPIHLLLGLVALVVTFLGGSLDPTAVAIEPSHAKYFFSGMIAVSAMLMPGISGSLLLINMGMYSHVVHAVKELDPSMFVFCLGTGIGLLAFSRLLKELLARFHDELMAVICGILLASLYIIWPWKGNLDGVPFSGQPNLLPRQYPTDPDVAWVVVLGLGGIALIALIQYAVSRTKTGAAEV